MALLMRVDASLMAADAAHSKQLADDFTQGWLAQNQAEVIHHDLSALNLGHLDLEMLGALSTPQAQRTPAQQQKAALADEWVAQLKAAQHLLIATPMYNFTVPSQLKTFIDSVARAQETFKYTEQGPVGLLTHLKATLIVTSGGDYTQAPLSSMDFVTPYLKTVLGFMGVEVVKVVVAPGLAMGPDLEAKSMQQARQNIAQIFN